MNPAPRSLREAVVAAAFEHGYLVTFSDKKMLMRKLGEQKIASSVYLTPPCRHPATKLAHDGDHILLVCLGCDRELERRPRFGR